MKKNLKLFVMLCLILCMCFGCTDKKNVESEQQTTTKETVNETEVSVETENRTEVPVVTEDETQGETEAQVESEGVEGYEEEVLDMDDLE